MAVMRYGDDRMPGTIGQFHRNRWAPKWMWIYCRGPDCGHSQPLAIAPLVIRWGPDAPAQWMRDRLICSRCGHRGVLTQAPGWGGSHIGEVPFPANRLIDPESPPPMCNLYSVTRSADEIRRLFAAVRDLTGNLPSLPGVYPDRMAPVVRMQDGERIMEMARWGFAPPPGGTRPVTNARDLRSYFWRLEAEHRCLVPATAFCEWTDTKPSQQRWFALSADQPLFAFAGLWERWTGTRGTKADPVTGEHRLFAFLTTRPNAEVAAVRNKGSMPVIFTTPQEWERWLTAPDQDVPRLRRGMPDGALTLIDPPQGD